MNPTMSHWRPVAVAALLTVCGSSLSLAQSQPVAKPQAGATPAPAAASSTPASQAASAAAAKTSAQAAGAPGATSEEFLGAATPILVEQVWGRVGARDIEKSGADAKFVRVKQGDHLTAGSEITISIAGGAGSGLKIRVGENQIFVFDQSGTFNIRHAFNDGQKDVTRIDVRQGRVSFDVNSTKARNDVKVECPDMILAVKGTQGGVEVASGFPTRAYGALTNTGHIEVDYHDGRKYHMRRSEQTDSAQRDPARNANERATIETARSGSRDPDEKRLLKRAASATQDIELMVGHTKGGTDPNLLPSLGDPVAVPSPGTVNPQPGTISHLDAVNGDLYQTTGAFESSLSRRSIALDPGAVSGGAALTYGVGSTPRFIYVQATLPQEGMVTNRVTEISLNPLGGSPRVLGAFSGSADVVPVIDGLGALGSSLYASGRLGERSALYVMNTSRMELRPVMDLGATIEGALGGSTERGSLFAVVRDPFASSSDPVLQRTAIVEVDPRNNYLANVYTNLGAGADTLHPGVDLDALQSFTGLATRDDSIFVSGVTTDDGGHTVLLRYDVSSDTPRLAEVRNAPDSFTHGLASERPGVVHSSVILSNPPGLVDRATISATFAELAYSAQALNSGFVERAVKREIIATSIDPTGCSASPALGTLRSYLQNHVDQRAGVGRSVGEFRQSLEVMHACQAMQMH